jgi:protein-S-isoprenylcysteine O-methyltransferase Ste14
MLDPVLMAGILTGELILYISVHLYMDIAMFRSSYQKSPSSEKVILSTSTMILAFLPSVGFWCIFLLSPWLVLSGLYLRVAVVPESVGLSTALQATGLFLLFLAVMLADWGRISRGVIAPSREMPEDYSLSTQGAYGVVRHPLYLSYDLFFVGLPLVLLNPWLLILLPGIYGYYRVAAREEEMLISRFGEQYLTYQQEVGMFIPHWKGRKQFNSG